MKFLSTTALSKRHDIKSIDLFKKIQALGWIDYNRQLTDLGMKKGGQTRSSSKIGDYVVWPEDIEFEENNRVNKVNSNLLSATKIGIHFNTSSQRVNLLLNELGLIKKTIAGWGITKLGKRLSGKQLEHSKSGSTYVLWPESILDNKDILELFDVVVVAKSNKNNSSSVVEKSDGSKLKDFRKKYSAEYRTKDGHYVRSKAELTIDDSLYLWGIPHAYEKKLPNTDEDVYSDFHIPSGKGRPKAVYIEYWGMENDEKYNQRKNRKIQIYNELGLSLIQLTDDDIKNIEDSLQKYLRKHRISVSLD